jgi:hypothetical protein
VYKMVAEGEIQASGAKKNKVYAAYKKNKWK